MNLAAIEISSRFETVVILFIIRGEMTDKTDKLPRLLFSYHLGVCRHK